MVELRYVLCLLGVLTSGVCTDCQHTAPGDDTGCKQLTPGDDTGYDAAMKILSVRLTQDQYSRVKQTVEAQLPRVSLQTWVTGLLERATQPAPMLPSNTLADDFIAPWEETTLTE